MDWIANETVPCASKSETSSIFRMLLSFSSVTVCQGKALNGVCDQDCNRVGCDYDREDCLPTQNEGLLGTIILQLEIDRETFDKRKEAFLQRFSKRRPISSSSIITFAPA